MRTAADGTFALTTPIPTAYHGEGWQSATNANLRIGDSPAQPLSVSEARIRRGETHWVTPEALR